MDKLPEVVRRLKERGIHTCVLYGSAAAGRLRRDSDVDLAVAGEAPLTGDERINIYIESTELLGREVDLLDLHRAEGLILKQALTGGRIVLNDNPEWLGNLYIKLMDYQTDLLPGVNEMLQAQIENELENT